MKEDLIKKMEKIPPEVGSMMNEGYEIAGDLVRELTASDLTEIWSYLGYLHSMFDTVLDETENFSKDNTEELITSTYANWVLEHAVLNVLLSEEFTQKMQSQKERIRAFQEKRKKIMANRGVEGW